MQTRLIHPIYNFPLPKLLVSLREQLDLAEGGAWCVQDAELLNMQLTMSAIMYELDALWIAPEGSNQHVASLPSCAVVIGTAGRLYNIASWYHAAASKKITFPQYRISKHNNNLAWENLAAWMDEVYIIKDEWASKKNNIAHEAELRLRQAALLTVRAESVYKRLDIQKIWNWVDVQMSQFPAYPAGRRETFKTIFMKADQAPEEWTLDDIEDVHFAIVETCDMGNDISFFINNRLRQIRAVIEDFYSSFTLLSSVSADGLSALDEVTPQEQAATTAFFNTFDKRATELEQLPEAPKRESFASFPKFLQAQAQWNILKRRYDMTKPAAGTPTNNAATNTGSQA